MTSSRAPRRSAGVPSSSSNASSRPNSRPALRQRVERRLRDARLGRFKPMADLEWAWPKQIHRPTVERVLTLDFLAKRENVIVVAPHGLGKTMLAKNLVHEAILAGHSARFLTAADLILDLTGQETARAPPAPPAQPICDPASSRIDEVGYLAYDAHAADLLFQVVSRRYEQKSIVITTNLPFKQWDTVFPECRVRRRADRPAHASRRDHLDRRRVLSQAGGRAGAEGATVRHRSACHARRRRPPVGPDLRGFT